MAEHSVDLDSEEKKLKVTEESDEESEIEEEFVNDFSETEDGKDFQEEFKWCLDDVQHEVTFSAFRHYKLFSDPGLHAEGMGVVGRP